jgi:hypothetical protein
MIRWHRSPPFPIWRIRWHTWATPTGPVGTTAAELGAEFGDFFEGVGYAPLARAALAAGDVVSATEASAVAQERLGGAPRTGRQYQSNR